jgi:hypothetical protein
VLKADLVCAKGVKRVETGMVTMNDAGQWVQLQHLQVGKNEATTVARFRFEGDSAAPSGVDMGTVRSTRALRMAAGGTVDVSDVIGVAKLVPPSLTEAWLSDLGQRIDLDAKALVQLADGGVQSRVIDVMVALAHPDKYQIGPAMTSANGMSQGRAIASLQTGRAGGNRLRTRCQYMDDFCYGPGGMGAWGFGYRYGMFDPWGFGYFNPYRYGGGLWGFNPYSPWGWGPGIGYWNPGLGTVGGPVVIVPGGPGSGSGGEGAVRGRAVRGGGYTREGYSEPRSPSSYSPPSSGGGSMGGSMGGSAGGSSGGGDGGRTAKPRGSGNL